jgi:hypothetical protein
MTVLELALILFIFSWALRVPAEPVRDRIRSSRPMR